MIDRHPQPVFLADLYRAASQLSALLAHASSDLGQPYAADSHARTAWLCADLAGDDTLGGHALGGHANIRLAVSEAEEALELFAAAPEREHSAELTAAAQLDLVAAHLALNDLDSASAHVQAILQLPSESRTVPIMGRMAKINQALASEAFDNATLASDLREQIAVFSAYPATLELPQSPYS